MKKGFTMIEMIATLLLVAILAVSVVISLLPMAQGLMQVRDNAAAAQKARLAMARVSREFTTITNVVSSSSSAITYDFLVPAGAWYATLRHTVALNGDELQLEGIPLCDNVAGFHLAYASGFPAVIDVVLTMAGELGGNAYSNHIVPRNIQGP